MDEKPVVYLSGASGFVGQNLQRSLGTTFDFRPISVRFDPAVQLKLTPAKAFVHLSGLAHDLKRTRSEHDYFDANFELTKQLFDSFTQSDIQCFIFLSSVKACRDEVQGELTEEMQPMPVTAYGKSKLLAEQYLLSRKVPPGKKVYILRPCMIHGPGNKGNLNLLFRFVKSGVPYPLGAFTNRRSYLSVDNLAFVIEKLIERTAIESGIYNIADDEALSTSEVVSLMLYSLKSKRRSISIPKAVIQFIALAGDKLHLPFNSERLGKMTTDYIVSNKKIKAALECDLPTGAREGMLRTIDSFK